jgi:hypothetical protein
MLAPSYVEGGRAERSAESTPHPHMVKRFVRARRTADQLGTMNTTPEPHHKREVTEEPSTH